MRQIRSIYQLSENIKKGGMRVGASLHRYQEEPSYKLTINQVKELKQCYGGKKYISHKYCGAGHTIEPIILMLQSHRIAQERTGI